MRLSFSIGARANALFFHTLVWQLSLRTAMGARSIFLHDFSMDRIRIETAHNVVIEHRLASVGERIGAYMIDGSIQIAYLLVAALLIGATADTNDDVAWIVALVMAPPFLFYHLWMEQFFNGRSFGKMALRIKVVRLDGSEVGFGAYFLRWLFRLVDISLFSGGVAILSILLGGKGQRIGDLIAGTTVVRSEHVEAEPQRPFETVQTADYQLQLPEVALLNDDDIQVLKEVMRFVEVNRTQHAIDVAYRTKEALEQKMGIRSELKARAFFETVLRDYTYFHGSIDETW